MRALAVLALLLAQDPDVDALLKQLEDESIEVREKAVAALIELGDSAEKAVESRMTTAEGELKLFGKRVLAGIQRNRAIRAVLPRFRRVTLEVKDAPIRDVISAIRKQSGLAIDLSNCGDARVTLSLKEALPFEALDAACRAAGLEFLPPFKAGAWTRPGSAVANPAVDLRSGHSGTSRAFTDPFVLSVTHVAVSNRTMFLTLSLYWSPQCKPTRFADFDILAAVDDKGTELPRPAGLFPWQNYFRSGWVDDFSVFLNEPAEGATKISHVRGRGAIEFAIHKARVRFEKPETCVGGTRTDDGLTVRLDQFTTNAKGNVGVRLIVNLTGAAPDLEVVRRERPADREFRLMNFAFNPEDLRLILEDGSVARARGCSSSGLPSKGMTIDLSYQGLNSKPVAVEFSLDTQYHREEFDFALKDIPLPK